MDDVTTVRDHSKPCEHGSLWPHWIESTEARWWREPECLGGREMTLERVEDRLWREVGPDDERSD